MNRSLIAILGAALLAGAAGAQTFTIDGSKDAAYPASNQFQTTPTGFGDSNSGAVDTANGSEIDGVFAQFTPGYLNIIFTGNLETNFNKLDIFFDVNGTTTGQNRLLANGGNLGRMGDDGSGNGLTFDAGFAPDYFLSATIGGTPTTMYVDYQTIPTDPTASVATYLGSTTQGANGVLSGGTNASNLLAAWNNSNTAGVSGTAVNDPTTVTTGVEFAIPTSLIGNVNYGTGVRIAAFVNGSSHDFVSNQVLGGLPNGTANPGDPRNVNFGNYAGNQYFAVPEPASMTALALGGFGLLIRRRKK